MLMTTPISAPPGRTLRATTGRDRIHHARPENMSGAVGGSDSGGADGDTGTGGAGGAGDGAAGAAAGAAPGA